MQVWTRLAAAFAASAALSTACGSALAQSAAGDWHGTVEVNGAPVPMGVTLKAKAGVGYVGKYREAKATLPVARAKPAGALRYE